MDGKTLNRVGWHGRRWLGHISWPWLAAGGLLAFVAGCYLSVVAPARDEAAALRSRLSALQAEIRRSEHAVPATLPIAPNQLEVFYRFFPSERSLPDWMDKIVAAASDNALTLSEGDYQVTRDRAGKLVRYQLTLPVKGAYPNIRGFIGDVLARVPIASLDTVKFERQNIGDGAVEATVLLTLHLEREP